MDTTSAGEERSTETRGDTILEVDNLKTYYGDGGFLGSNPVKAADGVSLDIQHDGMFGPVSESGCGKSTLGHMLMHLEETTTSEVRLSDTDITTLSGSDLKQFRKGVQMAFQDLDLNLNERITVGEIIHEPLDVYGWETPSERRERARELLETVGLQEQHCHCYPYQFSGGQRQRIDIVCVLALRPEFIIPDGPVSILDVSVQAKILNLLGDLQNELGLAYLFIAHDLAVVHYICDRVTVVYLGNMTEIGPADKMSDQPTNPYTHALLSSIPKPDPIIERDRITLRRTPPSPHDPSVGCPFSTRYPVKIRLEAYRDVDPELWECVEVFRKVLWECSRADPSLSDRVQKLFGRKNHRAGMDEVIPELFGDFDTPSDVMNHIHEAIDYAENDDEDAARTCLHEEFGSVCDHERPEQLAVSNRR